MGIDGIDENPNVVWFDGITVAEDEYLDLFDECFESYLEEFAGEMQRRTRVFGDEYRALIKELAEEKGCVEYAKRERAIFLSAAIGAGLQVVAALELTNDEIENWREDELKYLADREAHARGEGLRL